MDETSRMTEHEDGRAHHRLQWTSQVLGYFVSGVSVISTTSVNTSAGDQLTAHS